MHTDPTAAPAVPQSGTVSTETRPDPAVTTAVVRRVAGGREDEFVGWAEDGMTRVRRHPGFLGAGWLRTSSSAGAGSPGAVTGSAGTGDGGAEWHVVHRFADEDSLQDWLHSAERREWVARGAGMTHDAAVHRLSGVEGWFAPLGSAAEDAAPAAPPRWKQAVTIWLGFFPVSLLLAVLLAPHVGALDVVVRTLLTSLLTTPLMVYGVLPLVTRLVRPWLQRG